MASEFSESLTRAILEGYSFNSQEIPKAGNCVREGGSLSGRDRVSRKRSDRFRAIPAHFLTVAPLVERVKASASELCALVRPLLSFGTCICAA